jgi:hypothetical protein
MSHFLSFKARRCIKSRDRASVISSLGEPGSRSPNTDSFAVLLVADLFHPVHVLFPALIGMLTYGALVALYLAYISLAGVWTGLLLWPAVVLHVVLTGLLIWASARNKEANPEAY